MIANNIKRLREEIQKVCLTSGRSEDEIKLVAVSKYFGIKAITEAKNSGITNFGENKAQELRDKYKILGNDVIWHFIGTLQKNKVKYVVNAAALIHSIDSQPLIDEISKQAAKLNKVQDILLEVKTSSEETKSGIIGEEEIFKLAEYCTTIENINLIGLMTMAPLTDDEIAIRKSFRELGNLKDSMNKLGYKLTELSMGMTGDYKIAIEEGSTIIRIGTAIFGPRDYSKDWRAL